MLKLLNKRLEDIFDDLNFDKRFAFFNYSNRKDLGDLQVNASMPIAKILHKDPKEIGQQILDKLQNINYFFEKISIDGPGFINITLKNDFILNSTFDYDYKTPNPRNVLIEYSSPNVAKEMHVGHLKNAILGGSLERIYKFAGDKVITDSHLGDWGTNMGMVIEAIKVKYPHIKCFQENFNDEKIDDLNLTPTDLLQLYQFANGKAKEDKDFFARVLENTRLLQLKYKPYFVLWEYFSDVSIRDMKEVNEMLNISFDTLLGESFYEDICIEIVDELRKNGKAIISKELLVIDLDEFDMPPFILTKSNGSFLYSTTDLATVKYRIENYNSDLTLYVVDFRQSLHFKQLFTAAKKIGYITDKNVFEHVGYGTINGKDNRPFKTRSGDNVKLRDLIEDTIGAVMKKTTIDDKNIIQKIAIACLKFADLINFRESSYIFDMEQFTNFEGKTGAYILYSIVRINSILSSHKELPTNIEIIKTKEERELLIEFLKFKEIFKLSYDKRAPHFIAEYTYNLAKIFNTFYAVSHVNNETDEHYKKSKLALLNITKKYLETCLYLLNIETVEKM
jgi:arginyl-tRNA synthetase